MKRALSSLSSSSSRALNTSSDGDSTASAVLNLFMVFSLGFYFAFTLYPALIYLAVTFEHFLTLSLLTSEKSWAPSSLEPPLGSWRPQQVILFPSCLEADTSSLNITPACLCVLQRDVTTNLLRVRFFQVILVLDGDTAILGLTPKNAWPLPTGTQQRSSGFYPLLK